MRTIKFRAWVPQENRMAAGHAINDGIIAIGELYGTLMQFTGLFDKNGKEIYEGDIVRGSALTDGDLQNGEVCWWDGYGWEIAGVVTDGEFSELREWHSIDNIEVIGNIYENRELIKESK